MLDPDIELRIAALKAQGVETTTAAPRAAWSLRLRPGRIDAAALAWGSPLPIEPLASLRSGNRWAACLGPDEWLLLAEAGDDAKALFDLQRQAPLSIVDISDRETEWRIRGDAARQVLAAGCPLDLAEQAFPPNRATRTVFGQTEIILWRGEQAETWHFRALRSYADHLTRHLAAVIANL
jgi:sarcosine oxidase subunit gamma